MPLILRLTKIHHRIARHRCSEGLELTDSCQAYCEAAQHEADANDACVQACYRQRIGLEKRHLESKNLIAGGRRPVEANCRTKTEQTVRSEDHVNPFIKLVKAVTKCGDQVSRSTSASTLRVSLQRCYFHIAAMIAQAKILPSIFRSAPYRFTFLQQDLQLRAVRHSLASSSPDSAGTTLVVGGGRGLGLEFVRQLLHNSQHK